MVTSFYSLNKETGIDFVFDFIDQNVLKVIHEYLPQVDQQFHRIPRKFAPTIVFISEEMAMASVSIQRREKGQKK